MTSAEIVAEFVRGRPDLELEVRRKVTDPFCAPEARAMFAREFVLGAFREVTDDERVGLDRMGGNGAVDWEEVARIFGAPP